MQTEKPRGDDDRLEPDEETRPASGGGDESARMPDSSLPIRTVDLNRLLLSEPGLNAAEQAELGQFQRLLGATLHHEFLALLGTLKDLYAPLDPDSDIYPATRGTRALGDQADEDFLNAFETVLVRANYRPLRIEQLERAISAPNEKGLTFVPRLDLFEHLKVYVRGQTQVVRKVRNLRTRFRTREVVYPGFQRLVVMLKFRPDVKLDQYVRYDRLYLRLFKDVPLVDMEMHLPEQGTKVRMRMIDRAQIASPLAAFPATIGLKFLASFLWVSFSMTPLALGTLLAAPVTAGVNSFFGFQRAKQRHLHYMIRHLYYLNLANNLSVVTRLIDAAEEEEYKEALLAYFTLWRGQDDPDPWTADRLDAEIQRYLERHLGRHVDVEVADALQKLNRLRLVRTDGGGTINCVPVPEALSQLDHAWDELFRFSNATTTR